MPTSIGPDGIDVSGYGWTNQSTQFNSNKALQSYGAPNSSLYNTSANNGYTAWTTETDDATSTISPASGVVQLTRVFVPTSATVGHVDVNFTTAGTVSAFYIGIYSATGTLLAATAESHSAITATALTSLALTSPVNLSGMTNYYVGMTATWSVQPVVAGTTPSSTYISNANLTAATANSATAGSSATLPSTITMSSNTLAAGKIWYGLRA